jgi:hypothetical protein
MSSKASPAAGWCCADSRSRIAEGRRLPVATFPEQVCADDRANGKPEQPEDPDDSRNDDAVPSAISRTLGSKGMRYGHDEKRGDCCETVDRRLSGFRILHDVKGQEERPDHAQTHQNSVEAIKLRVHVHRGARMEVTRPYHTLALARGRFHSAARSLMA